MIGRSIVKQLYLKKALLDMCTLYFPDEHICLNNELNELLPDNGIKTPHIYSIACDSREEDIVNIRDLLHRIWTFRLAINLSCKPYLKQRSEIINKLHNYKRKLLMEVLTYIPPEVMGDE